MKKLIFVVFILLVLGLGFFEKNKLNFLDVFMSYDFKYIVSFSDLVDDENLVDVGFLKIGNYDKDELFKLNQKNKKYITSETIVLYNISPNEILKKLNGVIVSKYHIGQIEVYNCYVKNLEKFCYENDKKFNIQIAVNCDEIKVGYPTIAEGF